jgi:hypothetical protein
MNYFSRFDFFGDRFSNVRMRDLETVRTASTAVPKAEAASFPSLNSGGLRGLLAAAGRLLMHTSIDKNVSDVPFSGEALDGRRLVRDWKSRPLTHRRAIRREYLHWRCERHIQAGRRVPVDALPPREIYFPSRLEVRFSVEMALPVL